MVVVGAGVMGEVLVAAATKAGQAVEIVEADPVRAGEVTKKHGATAVTLADALGAANKETVVWLAVKPQQLSQVLLETEAQMTARPKEDRPLVISLAAGVSLSQIRAAAPSINRLIRIMPNTPARVGKGVTAIAYPGEHPAFSPDQSDLDLAQELLAPLGSVELVPEEELDAVTVIAGSGPAYLFYLAEAMTEAAVSLGLSPELAKTLVAETLVGSAALLRESTQTPAKLRSDVTSKGGVTLAATSYLDENSVMHHLVSAIEAAHSRAQDLGRASTNS